MGPAKTKIKIEILSLFLATFFAASTLYLLKDQILWVFNGQLKKYDTLLPLEDSLKRGDIVILGSSELTSHKPYFFPKNFFKRTLQKPIVLHGSGHHQTFAMMAQLASYYSPKILEKARLVVFLSPGWFITEGTNIEAFLNYMTIPMLRRLYFDSPVPDKFKMWVSEYLSYKKLNQVNHLNLIHYWAFAYKYLQAFDQWPSEHGSPHVTSSTKDKKKDPPPIQGTLPWPKYEREAKALEAAQSTSNSFGMDNDYFKKYGMNIPFKVKDVPAPAFNQEYKDFLKLVELLKLFKIKPLFIMQDLNPHVYQDLHKYHHVLSAVKKTIEENGFPYLDMWSWTGTKDYPLGKLRDGMHTGELGWVYINKFIYENYILKAM